MKPLYKYLIIAGAFIIFGVAFYFAWQKFATVPKPAETLPKPISSGLPAQAGKAGQTNGATEPTLKEGTISLRKLSDEPVFDFWLIRDTKEIFYITPEGKILSAKNGPDLEISNQSLEALNFIKPADGGRKALAAFGYPKSPNWGIFDTIDKVWRPLPKEIVNAAWGASNDKLIAVMKNNQDLNLSEIDASKTPFVYKTLIRDFRLKDVDFISRAPNELLIYEKPSAFSEGREWTLDLKTLEFHLVSAPAKGLTLNFSEDKNRIFKFTPPDNFFILDKNMKELTPLYFATFPDKCAAKENFVYCFAPQTFPQSSAYLNLPDDYFQNRFYTIDDFYSINTQTDDIKNVFRSNEREFPAINAKNPRTLDGNLIYFINKFDDGLYELSLK